jgi:phospholipid transport system substrate-binding protein
MSRRSLLALFTAAVLLLLPLSAMGAVSAQQFVSQTHQKLTSLLRRPATAQNDAKITATVDRMLDYATLAEESLGKHYGGLSDAQREEFKSLLRQLVRRAYQRDLRKTLEYEVSIRGSENLGEGRGHLVKTLARHRTDARSEPFSIDYVLHQVDGSWLVFDIITDGSSLVHNYRNQFHRVIKKHGVEGLLARMRKKAR